MYNRDSLQKVHNMYRRRNVLIILLGLGFLFAITLLGTNIESFLHDEAKLQDDGSYLAHLQFSMGGPWQVRVSVTVPGEQTVSATFEVTAQ